jgi:ABC-type polysaccharide/polyol phosphate transport system ATPase subunit
MSVTRIQFENVVQLFRVIRERPDTLREVFAKLFRRHTARYYDFTALKDVSFSAADGEWLGVIGRNGSGKSTLLKVIAGVYRPSSGKVSVNGKVAALIELAAGFHPELSGRENIVMNGLLLGLTRKQIVEREADIIDFADLGDFIDSPVKQYSSGMYMRLGFAIAIQVDPDILLMDEVLAVGDLLFKAKCLEKLEEFRQRGKTVLLVSHDMTAIRQHCRRALLIDSGQLIADGDPNEVACQYEELERQLGERSHPVHAH